MEGREGRKKGIRKEREGRNGGEKVKGMEGRLGLFLTIITIVGC